MEDLGYCEVKELVIEDYNDFIQEEGFDKEQAIAATLEDSILMIRKSHVVYVSAIVNLGLICLQEKFIVDYVYVRLLEILKDELIELSQEDKVSYQNDKKMLETLLSKENYEIKKDETYKARIDMLLA